MRPFYQITLTTFLYVYVVSDMAIFVLKRNVELQPANRVSICRLTVRMCITCVGTLLRKLESGLRGVSHVIVDEIHERDINVRC